MYVCLCKGVTDKAIAKAVAAGACSFTDVQNALGVSTQCGSCEQLARAIVAELAPLPATQFYELPAAPAALACA